MNTPVCPYCGNDAYMISGKEIYPDLKKIANAVFWKCQPCYAWVSCRPGTNIPIGTLANRETRIARKQAHTAFNYLPVTLKVPRFACYSWLADTLQIPVEECRISLFNTLQCHIVVQCAGILLENPQLLDGYKRKGIPE